MQLSSARPRPCAMASRLTRRGLRGLPAWRSVSLSHCQSLIEKRIVCITRTARRIESGVVRLVERGILGEARRQVRIGDEELAEGHGVSLAIGQHPFCRLLGEFLIGDIEATKLLLDSRSETRCLE